MYGIPKNRKILIKSSWSTYHQFIFWTVVSDQFLSVQLMLLNCKFLNGFWKVCYIISVSDV